jgi:hypothetical protein
LQLVSPHIRQVYVLSISLISLLFCSELDSRLTTASTLSLLKAKFMENVMRIHTAASQRMNPPLFLFQYSQAAANYNVKIMTDNNFDLNHIISKQHPSQLSYGSEFCDPSILEDLLHRPFWARLKSILLEGAVFPLEPISHKD